MSTRIISDGDLAVMYDSVSMTAFGPVVYVDEVDIEDFREFLHNEYGEPRSLNGSELEEAFTRFVRDK